MEHPKPGTMIGQSRILVSGDQMGLALQHHHANATQVATFRILSDPGLLSSQTAAWVKTAQALFPSVLEEWTAAVKNRAPGLITEVRLALAHAQDVAENEIPKFDFRFSGRTHIYLTVCPLCKAENVSLGHILPSKFTRLGPITKFVLSKKCAHCLPLPDELWQAIQNANAIVGEK